MEWTEFKYIKTRYKHILDQAKVFIDKFVFQKMKERRMMRDSEDAKFFAAHPQSKPDLTPNGSIMTDQTGR